MRRVVLAALGLASCAVPPPPSPTGPVLGYWHGEPPGPYVSDPDIVDLTLFGTRDATHGMYQISSDLEQPTIGGDGAGGLMTWSGTWTRQPEDYAGQRQSVIILHDALSRVINQYAVAPDGSLQPTSAYLGRRLTKQEIAIYSLAPIRGTGRALVD